MKQLKTPIEDLMPSNALMHQAWTDCLLWAVGHAEIRKAFQKDTGISWQPSRSPIEQMIDEATGAEADHIEKFIRWFNQNVWGEVNGRACNGDEPELSQ